MKCSVAFSALAFVANVAAHGGVFTYTIGGVAYKGFRPYMEHAGQSSIQRVWHSYDPITDVNLPIIACNDDGSPNSGQRTAPAIAGSKITATYNSDWGHGTGPLLAYLAKCPGNTCDEVNVNQLDWFKIAEEGLISGTLATGLWANKKMVNNKFKWTVTIPKSIPNGAYMLRFESIPLHLIPVQHYPQCAQIKISGGQGVNVPAEYLVKFPGAYHPSDPGLDINIYNSHGQKTTKYTIPGPKVYKGNSTAPAPSAPKPPTPKPTSTSPDPKPTLQPTSSSSSQSSQSSSSTSTTPGAVQTPVSGQNVGRSNSLFRRYTLRRDQ